MLSMLSMCAADMNGRVKEILVTLQKRFHSSSLYIEIAVLVEVEDL